MSVVTIIGAGMMGSAIGIPAAENGHEVRLVGTHLDTEIIQEAKKSSRHKTLKRELPAAYKYYPFEELDIALENCDLIVNGVSSFGVEWFAQSVLTRISNAIPILSVTKGMHLDDNGTLITFPEYYKKRFPNKDFSFNAVGGPCTSYELADHDQTEVCFCGEDPVILAGMRKIFETDYYHISTSTDVTGVEVAVAMKNAYALAVCMAVGAAKKRNSDGHENYNCKRRYLDKEYARFASCSSSLAGKKKTSFTLQETCMLRFLVEEHAKSEFFLEKGCLYRKRKKSWLE